MLLIDSTQVAIDIEENEKWNKRLLILKGRIIEKSNY